MSSYSLVSLYMNQLISFDDLINVIEENQYMGLLNLYVSLIISRDNQMVCSTFNLLLDCGKLVNLLNNQIFQDISKYNQFITLIHNHFFKNINIDSIKNILIIYKDHGAYCIAIYNLYTILVNNNECTLHNKLESILAHMCTYIGINELVELYVDGYIDYEYFNKINFRNISFKSYLCNNITILTMYNLKLPFLSKYKYNIRDYVKVIVARKIIKNKLLTNIPHGYFYKLAKKSFDLHVHKQALMYN